MLRDLKVPGLGGTRLTLGLVRRNMDERGIADAFSTKWRRATQKAGPFEVEFIAVSHSIPDACSLAVHSPAGTVVLTGRLPVRPHSSGRRKADLSRFAELGREGVLALMSDSTNVERPGFGESERRLTDTFDRIFANSRGRIIVACFASNIHRVQQVADMTIKHNRQMAVIGRSMEQNVATARSLGYLQIPDWAMIDINQIDSPRTVAGELHDPPAVRASRSSVLSRLAMDDHKKIRIEPGDTVIISAKPIPGNEALVQRVINNLFKGGAEVIYDDNRALHFVGPREQGRTAANAGLVKPRYVVPVHGEYRHLAKYAEMAVESGYAVLRIIRPRSEI